MLAGAVAIIVAVGNPAADQQRAPLSTWVVVILVMGPALVLCVLGARIWPGAVAAVLLALVAGSSLALFAVLTKGVVEAGQGGVVALLRAPELYAWLAVALAGMVFQQASFRAGSLTASLPTMTLAKPVVGWILGITVLSEDAARRRRGDCCPGGGGDRDDRVDGGAGQGRGRRHGGVWRAAVESHRAIPGAVDPLV